MIIVAHPLRSEMARDLAYQVGGTILLDSQGMGCAQMHVAAIRSQTDEWSMVCEDDAIPVPDFRVHAGKALGYARSPLVSFHLSKGSNPAVQTTIRRCLDFTRGAWISADCLMTTVGYAVHRSIQRDLLAAIDDPDDPAELPVRITRWAQRTDTEVHYTWPSLLDHREGFSVIGRRDIRGRVAHRFGAPDRWDTEIAELGPVPGWSVT